jgi:ribosomal protein S18 acetylase RimI-like enzyme
MDDEPPLRPSVVAQLLSGLIARAGAGGRSTHRRVAAAASGVPPERLADLFAVLEQMDDAHPTFSHWYLPWFGVDGGRQGNGVGRELMRSCLEFVDQEHMPAYLETPNARNITFYERHGFEVTGTSQAGGCPPRYSMLRRPR